MSEQNVMIVECKIRRAFELLTWEDRKVEFTLKVEPVETETGKTWMVVGTGTPTRLSEAVELVAKALHSDVVEVRWNFEGSLQGHYFTVGM